MARQKVGEKKLRRLAEKTGLDLVAALVRGGTDHRIDLCVRGGEVVHLYRCGASEKSVMRHSYG